MAEREEKGGAWTAPAEGPAKGWAAEAIHDRRWGRMASLATGNAGKLPTLGLWIGARAAIERGRDPEVYSYLSRLTRLSWHTAGFPKTY